MNTAPHRFATRCAHAGAKRTGGGENDQVHTAVVQPLVTISGNAALMCAVTCGRHERRGPLVTHHDIYGGSFELLSILSTVYRLPVEIVAASTIESAAAKNAKRRLAHIQEQFGEAGITVFTLHLVGISGATILARAKELSADYIAIGSHGHGAFYDLIVGSTTSYVRKEATCPVLVIPRDVTPDDRVASSNLEPAEAVRA